ncbi:phosphoheptose isomerase 1 [Rhodoferax lithotrophicus]|uniref:Phosphoheptose isomerase n=1 Tax=Rhodoferax lithotrophicus TaxID=2798804 RepID=A0ABN6DBI7_9BURK|nr:D-sedoheptulose 7-phosphate isomerase [Rhodoferax sp. MIZ03]BCO27353.1 phosphoheptose isomerase 1 [Rhodoferax sp. MIZ03]
MNSIFDTHISQHLAALQSLTAIKPAIEDAGQRIADCLLRGNKVMLCGNGGSAADAQHIAAELVGRFLTERKGLPAMALTTDTSILTAVANDYGYTEIFSRQVQAHARPGDVLIGISTSGNSANVLTAMDAAKFLGCITIGLLGREGGQLSSLVDHAITVPAPQTAAIQECHILIGHLWCAMVDAALATKA